MNNLIYLQSIPLPHLGEDVVCRVYESRKARRSWIRICSEQGIRIVLPKQLSGKELVAKKMLERSGEWITKHWERARQCEQVRLKIPESLMVDGRELKGDELFSFVKMRLIKRTEELAKARGLSYDRVTVRRQKKHWGSCSRRRCISLNWKVGFLPEDLRDYVIYHELAHLQVFNHSPRFWEEVERMCCSCKVLDKTLKAIIM
ncbi:MAG: hypothetical protein BWY68_00910 [bacterium ADurb.Bin400]|nr:MAG: hypothetical protein BWY68_00910 [bacterium ADurb.Bin400]